MVRRVDSVLFASNDQTTMPTTTNQNVSKAQDLKMMLDAILDDYIKLHEVGFVWDL